MEAKHFSKTAAELRVGIMTEITLALKHNYLYTATMKITVDPKKCLGCGTCSALAPKTFKLNKKGKAEVLPGKIDSPAVIKMAAKNCPTGAISIKP